MRRGRPPDFLSRNGLAYGKLYGFSTNMTATGSGTANGLFMDAYSKVAAPGSTVNGAFYPLDWQWDGEVKSFMHDGSWAFQHKPDSSDSTIEFWNPYGNDKMGHKSFICVEAVRNTNPVELVPGEGWHAAMSLRAAAK